MYQFGDLGSKLECGTGTSKFVIRPVLFRTRCGRGSAAASLESVVLGEISVAVGASFSEFLGT